MRDTSVDTPLSLVAAALVSGIAAKPENKTASLTTRIVSSTRKRTFAIQGLVPTFRIVCSGLTTPRSAFWLVTNSGGDFLRTGNLDRAVREPSCVRGQLRRRYSR